MAALDRLEDLKDFLLGLQPEDVFRPRRVWQFPGGLHDYPDVQAIAAFRYVASYRPTDVALLERMRAAVPRRRQSRLRDELDEIFATARFPFRHDRHIPSMVVRATPGDDGLDPTFRGDEPWPEERKRALIERGYRLTEDALAAKPHFGG